MTKNKNRKDAVRKLAVQEGVGIARATTLHDRERESARGTVSPQIDAERPSWALGTDFITGKTVYIDFELLNGNSPHFMVSQGSEAAQINVLESIRLEVEASGIASTVMFSDVETEIHHIKAAIRQYHANLAVLANIGTDDFSELREVIGEVGQPDYTYVFIYDFEYAISALPADLVKQINDIIEFGWNSGVRIIAARGEESKDEQPIPDNTFMNFIKLETGIDQEYAELTTVEYENVRFLTSFHFGNVTVHSSKLHPENGELPYVILEVENHNGGNLGYFRITRNADGSYTESLEEAESPESERLLISVHASNVLRPRLKKIASDYLK